MNILLNIFFCEHNISVNPSAIHIQSEMTLTAFISYIRYKKNQFAQPPEHFPQR